MSAPRLVSRGRDLEDRLRGPESPQSAARRVPGWPEPRPVASVVADGHADRARDRLAGGATSFISGTRPDPDLVLRYRFAAGGAGNYSAWVHPEVEAAVSEGRSTYDTAGCQAAYEKLQTVVHQEAYYEFIWRRKQTVAATSALMDLEPTLSNSSLDKKRAQGVGGSSGL